MPAAVPRVFEKLYANIMQKGREYRIEAPDFRLGRRVANSAVRWKAYGEAGAAWLQTRWKIADQIVYSKIRDGIGGRIRAFISGGGPLARELAEFFWAVGVPVYQGYGLTETSPVLTVELSGSQQSGHRGTADRDVEVRIAEDGEILVHGRWS